MVVSASEVHPGLVAGTVFKPSAPPLRGGTEGSIPLRFRPVLMNAAAAATRSSTRAVDAISAPR
jgi:hypothetical protein